MARKTEFLGLSIITCSAFRLAKEEGTEDRLPSVKKH